MIAVEIDELTPCLKDNSTGAILETEVIRIKRASFLKNYNSEQVGILIGQNYLRKMKFMHW